MTKRDEEAIIAACKKAKQSQDLYYTTHSLMGYRWATWNWLIGARGRGKSYSADDTYLSYRKKYGPENVKCYYFRISDLSIKTMLQGDCSKAIDAKLQRKYNLELSHSGDVLYDHDKPLMTFYPLVSAAKKGKGVAEYDPDFLNDRPIDNRTGKPIKRFIFIIIDEFMMAEGVEKKSVGNPVEQFKIYIENILRDQERLDYPAVKVFGCANAVSECSDFLAQLCSFIPEKPGRYKLKRIHTIIDNIPNSEAYIEKRKKSYGADIMDYESDSNYTNVIKRDIATLVPKNYKKKKVIYTIKFDKNPTHWYNVWDDKVICKWNNQPIGKVIAMKRYLDTQFIPEMVNAIIEQYDARAFLYTDMISQATFAADLKLIKSK